MYSRVYDWLCGTHPDVRPWHFQWLATVDLHRALRPRLAELHGDVLDVGARDKPYGRWLGPGTRHIGLDVESHPAVDVLVEPGAPWPLADGSVDAVVCTQVLQHVQQSASLWHEMARVLRPGGVLIVSAAFLYPEHGMPHDYRRVSRRGLETDLSPTFDIRAVEGLGGPGTALGLMWLLFLERLQGS